MVKDNDNKREWFKMKLEWSDNVEALTDERAGKVFKAIYRAVTKECDPDFSGDEVLTFFWITIKNWLNEEGEAYRNKIAQTARAGKASAEKRKKNKSVNECQRVLADVTESESESEKEKEGESSSSSSSCSSSSSFDDIKDYYSVAIGFNNADECVALKELARQYDKDYIIACIDFMKSKRGNSVNYLKEVCKTNEPHKAIIDFTS